MRLNAGETERISAQNLCRSLYMKDEEVLGHLMTCLPTLRRLHLAAMSQSTTHSPYRNEPAT